MCKGALACVSFLEFVLAFIWGHIIKTAIKTPLKSGVFDGDNACQAGVNLG